MLQRVFWNQMRQETPPEAKKEILGCGAHERLTFRLGPPLDDGVTSAKGTLCVV